MDVRVTCFYDYTCSYSYRVWTWLTAVEKTIPDLEVKWATFSLKEVNRESGPSLLEGDEILSTSVLALALAHAARSSGFDFYHRQAFDLMHKDGRRIGRDELLGVAAEAGVDVRDFEQNMRRWLAEVASEHSEARSRWEVFGTPTLVFADETAVYLKLSKVPETNAGSEDLWRAVRTISVTHPELLEIKRSH
jgi:predicted DsbA family dithiol-disulfide isomerase